MLILFDGNGNFLDEVYKTSSTGTIEKRAFDINSIGGRAWLLNHDNSGATLELARIDIDTSTNQFVPSTMKRTNWNRYVT